MELRAEKAEAAEELKKAAVRGSRVIRVCTEAKKTTLNYRWY